MRRNMLAYESDNEFEKSNSAIPRKKVPNKADSWMKLPGWSQGMVGASKIGNFLLGMLLVIAASLCQPGGGEGANICSKNWHRGGT